MSTLLVALILRSVVAPAAEPPPCEPPPKVRLTIPCEPHEGCIERWVWVEPGLPVS